MIAALFNIPTDAEAMQQFSFHNNDSHVLAIRAIKTLTGLTLPQYPLDPIPPQNLGGWLYDHQAMHNSVNQTLGLPGNDLSDVDPSKLDQLTFWIQLHAQEHVAWSNALGFG